MKNILLKKILLATLLFFAALILLGGCTKENDAKEKLSQNVSVSDDGTIISFPAGSAGLNRIKSKLIQKSSVTISVLAPARVVASISSAISSKEKIVLFESSDIATLYSQYKQAKANVELTQKNLDRVKDMFNNLAATGKDINQSENDAANARTSLAETESRLRTSGFNPKELDETPAGTIWMIADVVENQLNEVEKGESVDIFFNAFPDKKFIGNAVAIGDVVDPTTRTVKVRVILKNPENKFLPGMFGKVDFGDPKNNTIIIPLTSIVTVEGKDYVFIDNGNGTFRRQQIIISQQTNSVAVILSGIKDGEKVVDDGSMLLKGLSFKF